MASRVLQAPCARLLIAVVSLKAEQTQEARELQQFSANAMGPGLLRGPSPMAQAQ